MKLYSRTRLAFFAVLAGVFISSAALALDSDKNAPVTIDADTTSIDFRTGKRVLTGNVEISQGTLNIKADKIVLVYKGDEIDTATAYGNPVKFKQLPEGQDAMVYGEGKILIMVQAKNLITLKKNAKVTQGTNVITGKTIDYNTKTSKMTIKSQSPGKKKKAGSSVATTDVKDSKSGSSIKQTSSGRTRIVIQPGTMKK